jgi:hypothetical protein
MFNGKVQFRYNFFEVTNSPTGDIRRTALNTNVASPGAINTTHSLYEDVSECDFINSFKTVISTTAT